MARSRLLPPSVRKPRVVSGWALAAVIAAAAAAAAQDPSFVPGPPSPDRVELRAVLLEGLERGGLPEGLWGGLRREPDPSLRVLAVRVLSSAADPGALPRLRLFLLDPDPRVREAVLIAAGRIGAPAAALIRPSLPGPSPLVRRAAVWAACHTGEALASEVLARVSVERDPGVLETALASLWRLPEGRWEAAATSFADHPDPLLRRAAAYSLARGGGPLRLPPLRRLAVDAEPVIRATAQRGLGQEDGALLARALADPDPRVRAAACLRLVGFEGDLPEGTGDRVARLTTADEPHLAAAAVRALGSVPGGEQALLAAVAGDDSWLAAEALEALARSGSGAAAGLVETWLGSGETWRRRAAAASVVRLEAAERLLRRALGDAEPAVRLALVESLEEAGGWSEPLAARLAVEPDTAVRAALVELLAEEGRLAPPRLLELAGAWRADAAGDARAAALAAAWRAGDPGEHRRALALAASDPDPAVTARVAAEARAKGESVDTPRRPARHPSGWYRELVAWSQREHRLELETTRGTVGLSLDSAAAPLTARAVWELAAKGFYDGLTFHRVVPNFVVQGGDPRGDGWGGPGFVLADEPDLRPFDSWRVGIATSGPNTGGCQLFVTLMPSDHLTGHYTNVAEVVSGREVLTRLRRGDRILRVRPEGSGTTPAEAPGSAR